MPSLPPLRTVRESNDPESSAAPGSSHGEKAIPGAPPGLSPVAIAQISELQAFGLLGANAVEEFAAKAKDRLSQLNKPERVRVALVHYGMITEYQRNRVESGNAFGLSFGNYRILDRLSSGTVGVVFLAENIVLKRRVAVKVLPGDDTGHTDRMSRVKAEIEVLARINHPHVVGVYDAGVLVPKDEWQPTLQYLVLELVSGGDLEQFVYANGEQPVPVACEWGRQAATALAAAHAHDIIHRDLKPSNLLLTASRRVKLSDFGLARHFASTRTPRPGVLGSVEFMPPEQSVDPTTAGPAADIYGLGAVMFWVLTGKLPYPRPLSLSEAVEKLRTTPPRRLRELLPDAPEALDALIARMLRRNPAERPDALDVAAGLARFAAPGTLATAEPLAGAEFDSHEDQLRDAVSRLEDLVMARDEAAAQAQAAVLATLAGMAQARGETAGHQRRISEYVRVLAAHLARHQEWPMLADPAVVKELQKCAVARNVGVVAVPEEVLAKAGDLTPKEQAMVQAHTVVGDRILATVAETHGASLPFLRTARAVIRHHHERWNGTGYPDRLVRDAIPPAARVVALVDAYDALRRPTDVDPGLEHLDAVDTLFDSSPGHFDPVVLEAFKAVHFRFNEIYMTIPD
jgi:tRNA A-37 threonylcarbamoyl transferase component Bud32